MKFVLLSLSLLSVPAFATDFSGCAPKVFPKSRPEYKLKADGTLQMERGGPDVIRAESSPEQDRYVTRYSDNPVKNQVQELNRENGKPLSLRTYFTDAKGKPTGNANTRYFGYAGPHCFLSEVEFEEEGSGGQRGTFVTYARDFCDRLLKASGGMTESAGDVSRVGKVLADYDKSLAANGRHLFGFEAARMKKEGPDVIASVVGTCKAIGSSFEQAAVMPPKRPGAAAPAAESAGGAAGAQ
jgi:hypothetical protein